MVEADAQRECGLESIGDSLQLSALYPKETVALIIDAIQRAWRCAGTMSRLDIDIAQM